MAKKSSYVYGKKDLSFEEIKNLILENLPENSIEKIYNQKEAASLGADPRCFMMVEASRGYLFQDQLTDKVVMDKEDLEKSNIAYHLNNHGYSPYLKEDYETVFIIKGPGIKEDFKIGKMKLIDEGPTFAKIFGLYSLWGLASTNGYLYIFSIRFLFGKCVL